MQANTRLSFGSILFFIFLVFKLTESIDWSWLWVTAPLWIPLAAGVALLTVALVLSVVSALFGVGLDVRYRKRRRRWMQRRP